MTKAFTLAVAVFHPVISDGRLYVRNQDTLLVYDIRPAAGKEAPHAK